MNTMLIAALAKQAGSLARCRAKKAAREEAELQEQLAAQNAKDAVHGNFVSRLKKAIAVLEQTVAAEVPRWSHARDLSGLHLTDADGVEKSDAGIQRCMEVFVAEVKEAMDEHLSLHAKKAITEFRSRLTENTETYLTKVMEYREKMAPWLRAIDVTCPEEHLRVFKPLEKWSKDEERVMRKIIDERVLQLYSLTQERSLVEQQKKMKAEAANALQEDEEEEEEEREEAQMERLASKLGGNSDFPARGRTLDDLQPAEPQSPTKQEADEKPKPNFSAHMENRKNQLKNDVDELQKALNRIQQKVKESSSEVEMLNEESRSFGEKISHMSQQQAQLQRQAGTAKPGAGNAQATAMSKQLGGKATAKGQAAGAGGQFRSADAFTDAAGNPVRQGGGPGRTSQEIYAELPKEVAEALRRMDKPWAEELAGLRGQVSELEERLARLRERKKLKESIAATGKERQRQGSGDASGEAGEKPSLHTSVVELSRTSTVSLEPSDGEPPSSGVATRYSNTPLWEKAKMKSMSNFSGPQRVGDLFADAAQRASRQFARASVLQEAQKEQFARMIQSSKLPGDIAEEQVDPQEPDSPKVVLLNMKRPRSAGLKSVQSEAQLRVRLRGALPSLDDSDFKFERPQVGRLNLPGEDPFDAQCTKILLSSSDILAPAKRVGCRQVTYSFASQEPGSSVDQ